MRSSVEWELDVHIIISPIIKGHTSLSFQMAQIMMGSHFARCTLVLHFARRVMNGSEIFHVSLAINLIEDTIFNKP